MLFDRVATTDIERLRNNASERRAAFEGQGELATVARILEAEHQYGGALKIFSIERQDNFDLLDLDAIRAQFGDRFPGHSEAGIAFAQQGGGKADERKDFYKRAYRVEFSASQLRKVARRMREAGKTSEILDDILDRVDLLTLTTKR